MRIKSTMLAGLTIIGVMTPMTQRVNAATSGFRTSDVMLDLKSDEKFDVTDYPLSENITDEKAISGITLVEDQMTDLFFYIYNCNGKDLSEGLRSARMTMSTDPTNSDDTTYYDLDLLSHSEDYLFWKFKVDYVFPETYSEERAYCISEIEFDYGNGYSEGRHNTIGQFYRYTGQGDTLTYELKNLEVVELEINPGSYRFNVPNANSTANGDHYWDLFYITFPIRRDYGDLIGIKLTWTEYLTDQESVNGKVTDLSKTIEMEPFVYRNADLMNLISIKTMGTAWDKFTYNLNPMNWLRDQSTDYDIKVIEKVEFDHLSSSTFEGYYFDDETITTLNDMYYRTIGSSDFYVIRFAYRDFCNYVLSTDFSNYYKRFIKTEIQNCDVLTLTFLKDGTEYTLMVSSKPVNIDPGNENPKWGLSLDNLLTNLINLISDLLGINDDLARLLAILLVVFVVFVVISFLYKLFVPKKRR